jgi:hypothetical protein
MTQIAGRRLTYAELTGKVGRNGKLRLYGRIAGSGTLRRSLLRNLFSVKLGFYFRMRYGYKSSHKTRKAVEVPFGILGGRLRVIRHTRS